MKGAYLGPSYSDAEIEAYLRTIGASYRRLERAELLHTVARHLSEEKVVGWFNGRMEFGPQPWAPGASSAIRGARACKRT
jgi:carbamoyltransferase